MACIRVKITRLSDVETMDSKYISGLNEDAAVHSLIPHVLQSDEDIKQIDIKCVLLGELLDLDRKLGDCNLNQHSFIHFVIKPKPIAISNEKSPKFTLRDISQLQVTLHWAMRSGRLKELINLVTDPMWIEQAVIKYPALGFDSIAYSIIQDRKMLHTLLQDRASIDRLCDSHPTLIAVLQLGLQTIFGPRGDPSHRDSSTATFQDYTVDQDYSTEDTDESLPATAGRMPALITPYGGTTEPGPTTDRGNSSSRRNSPRFSRQQLAAALSLARTSHAQARQTSLSISSSAHFNPTHSGSRTRGLRDVPSQVFPDGQPTTTSTVPSTIEANELTHTPSVGPQPHQWTEQLSQLAEMGFTDEAVAIRVLEATGGDVALAIHYLFDQ